MWSLLSLLAIVPSLLPSSTSFVAIAAATNYGSGPTCNTPSNRACWSNGFDIHTDYETKTPITGVTRKYSLEITQVDNYIGPDGQTRPVAMLINNQFPGPVLTADWGDMFEITVTNKLKFNGTTLHWHGIRQLNTNMQDGVNGVTECPIAPNTSRKYRFLAQQYGTSWYHSHFSAQYGDGVVGSLVINGPASMPYDIDLGAFPLTDFYNDSTQHLVEFTKNNGPPPSNNVLFNGSAVNPATGLGKYANVTLKHGKRHRLRIINNSVENHYVVNLAHHDMTIISADFVPVQTQTVGSLFIGVGQRYDVVIDASQAVDNYWFNVTFVTGAQCGTSYNPHPAALFHYEGASGGLPTDPGSVDTYTSCTDLSNLTPVVPRTIDTSAFTPTASNTVNISLAFNPGTTPVFAWQINGSIIDVDWNHPIDEGVLAGNLAFPASDNIIRVDQANQWVFFVIENDRTFGIPHPIHLHGHDYVLLARSPVGSTAPFNPATDLAGLNGRNPVRRDVVMLPGQGWIVIAFKADNPGTWLMHCHIAWHISGGLGLNFLERPTDFKNGVSAADKQQFKDICTTWNNYFPQNDPDAKIDSGLKRWAALQPGTSNGVLE